MKIKPEFMLHQIGEEYIVMHDGSTNVDFSRIINLNHTAAYLWQRFRDADFDADALTAALTERYDVAPEQARRDAEAFIQSLQRCASSADRAMMQQAFFSLVRAGLWDTPADAALFRGLTPAQWQELHRLAHTQSLLAVVFDGLNTLPADLRPPRPLYLQWAAQTLQIEQANDRLDRMIVRLDRLYTDAGLHPVLLKGQGMAACYRQPRHRQCGDIDVYLGKDGQPRANRLLLEDGAQETGEESDKHASYELDGVHVENHRLVNRTNNPLANRRFRRLVREWYPQGTERRIGMATPPPTFNALYIFLHAFEHFLNSGIGLRQLCDWCCLLRTRRADLDDARFVRDLRRLGLLRAARAFGYVCVSRLGLPSDCLPFDTEGCRRLGEDLVDEIFATGNFGKHDRRVAPRPKGYWRGKWHTFCRATRRVARLYGYAPVEACFYPVTLIKGTLAIQLNLLKKRLRL